MVSPAVNELDIIAEPDSGNGLAAGRFVKPLPSPIKDDADTWPSIFNPPEDNEPEINGVELFPILN